MAGSVHLNINGTHAALLQAFGPTAQTDVTALTPDALMAYCSSRLRGLDASIKEHFAIQNKSSADSKALNELLTTLNGYGSGTGTDAQKCKNVSDAAAAAIAAVGTDSPLHDKLVALKEKIDATGINGDQCIGDSEMKEYVEDIKGMQSDLSADSELNMITLQSVMSQRQTAIQLTTNLIQTLNETTNKVVSNIHT